jgi:vitamin B12 transporter
MTRITLRFAVSLILLTASSATWSDDATNTSKDEEVSEITVRAARVANESPASSYATLATALRFDPLTELQSRGIAEGQSDVTVRGGLFENTGFKLGASTIMDPQTGHYVAELPVDPAMMSAPAIYKGIDAAVEGFNSAVATVSYGINRVNDGGYVSLGAGSDNLNYQSFRFAHTTTNSTGNDVGVAVSLARSEGDGSVDFGDHEFARANVQLQHATDDSQTDLIVAYQDKFFGWPGAYTGFASLPETDDTQTTLVVVNHRRESDSGWIEAGGFYRRLVDDYDFNRTTIESGTPGSFEHETKVFGAGFQGQQQSGRISWRYGGQVTADELVRSTDLTNGFFTDRTYATVSVVPSIESRLASGSRLIWRAGATFDYSDQDSNEVSPLLGVTLSRSDPSGSTNYSFEYAATSQVPGYTALNSNPSGLFGGNPFLGREKAKQLAASIERETGDWQLRATVFSRRDDDLVDWTYETGAPFARQANAVDIDVIGFEAFFVRSWESLDLAFGYTALDKDADYGTAQVDASFYALNFAKHRATLALIYRFAGSFEFRLDNEYRSQEANPLRVGDDSTYLASVSLRWASAGNQRFSAALVVDNATDSEYQPFPGTPASGRQLSLSASYGW